MVQVSIEESGGRGGVTSWGVRSQIGRVELGNLGFRFKAVLIRLVTRRGFVDSALFEWFSCF